MHYSELTVAKTDELKAGDMKKIPLDDETNILLFNIKGTFYATGCCCTHYGAPLADGVLHGDHVVCPWHNAVFQAQTGDLQEPPALDPLPTYEVEVKGDEVVVKLPQTLPGSGKLAMAGYAPDRDQRTFVILGAGAAGNMAAQILRENGYEGRIVLITAETHLPYDRPNLSKGYLQGSLPAKWMPLRSEQFYHDHGIELWRETRVTKADVNRKILVFHHGEPLAYDKLLVATGGIPRSLDLPGVKLRQIFTLRSFEDADQIIRAGEAGTRVAVIGASFIGIESAYSLAQRGLDVTVIAPETVPFENIFGKAIGGYIRQSHEASGVTFKLGATPAGFEGTDRVEAVQLTNGEHVAADVVIIGVGVKPNTGFLQGLDLQPDGSIKVDPLFHAGNDVYAAGDIATFADWRSGQPVRIEHWRTAEQQGRIAARNMMMKQTAYHGVPFFWSKQGDLNVKYVGHAPDWDENIMFGDIASGKGLVLYVKGEKVLAAAGLNRGQDIGAIHELMHLNKMPSPDTLRSGKGDFLAVLGQVSKG